MNSRQSTIRRLFVCIGLALFIAAWDLFAAPEKVAAEEAQDAAVEAQQMVEAEEKAQERADVKAANEAGKEAEKEAVKEALGSGLSIDALPGTASFVRAPVPQNPGRTNPAGRS